MRTNISWLLTLVVFFAPTVWAADVSAPGVTVSRGDLLKRRQYQTNGTLALFVDSTGNDGNACLSSGTGACLTIAGAISKLPQTRIDNDVTITVGTGTFVGTVVSGFTVSNTGSLVVQGTLSNFAVATGTATGTLTAASAGSSSTTTWGTATDGTQTWTVNDLRGKLLTITGGTGSGQSRIIASNSATVATIVGGWGTTPTAGSTYAIQEQGTIISSGPTITNWDTGVTTAYSFVIGDLAGNSQRAASGSTGARFALQRMKFTSTSRNIEVAVNASAALRQNWHSATASYVVMEQNSTVFANDNLFSGATTSAFTAASSGVIQSTNNLYTGATIAIQPFSSAITLNETGSYYYNNTSAITTATALQFSINMSGTVIDCNSIASSLGIGNTAATLLRPIQMQITGSAISNCIAGIDVRGPASISLSSLAGTGNTTIFRFDHGANVQIASTVSTAGTTELVIDGDTYTLAALRALTPKAIANLSYGTNVYE